MRAAILEGLQEDTREQEAPAKVALLDPTRPTRAARRAAAASARGRVTVAAAAALCLLMTLSGMSLLLSRDAVPGDALYAMKRTAEAAELGLTFGDDSKARKHLEFASSRVDEIEVLAAEAGPNSNRGSGKIIDALDDFDKDASAASRLITGQAAKGDDEDLESLRGWAQQQGLRLDELSATLPLEVGARLASSLNLLERVQDRAATLSQRAECETIASGAKDELGPLPARVTCAVPDAQATADTPGGAPLVPNAVPPASTAPVLPGAPPNPTTSADSPTDIVTDALPLPLPALQDPSAPPPIVVDLPLLEVPLEVPPVLPKTPGIQVK